VDVLNQISQVGDRKDRLADHVAGQDSFSIGQLIGDSFSAKCPLAILLCHFDDPVRRHRSVRKLIANIVVHLQFFRIDILYIDHGARHVYRFHGAGQHHIDVQSKQSNAYQGKCKEKYQADQQAVDAIPYFFDVSFHSDLIFLSTLEQIDCVTIPVTNHHIICIM